MSIRCVRCERDSVNVFKEMEKVDYKGKVLTYSMAYSMCNFCGDEYISTEQIKENEASLKAVKREADGVLSPDEIKHTRTILGLSQEYASMVFGGGRNAFSKYERGEVSLSQSMDTLLKLCVRRPALINEIELIRLGGNSKYHQDFSYKVLIESKDIYVDAADSRPRTMRPEPNSKYSGFPKLVYTETEYKEAC